jgi:membrane protein required for colicin V production
MNASSFNPFDAVVAVCLLVAVAVGFMSGLLRSLATIFGYLAAMPVVAMIVPEVAPFLANRMQMSSAQILLALFVLFMTLGIIFAALLRAAVGRVVGPRVSIPDRLAGALLGAVRVGLLAVLIVVIFDRIIPADRQPSFLADSRLRPPLSRAGQMGLKSLPPEAEDFIEQLKRRHGI